MNQIVVITGASSGLGLSLAERFLKRGDWVYGVSRTRRGWREAQRGFGSNRHFQLRQVDVRREPQVKRFLASVAKKTGRIDVLVNNAGAVSALKPLEEESLQEFQQNLSSNLISVFLMCKYALPIFRKQKSGWIINIASYAGKRAVPLLAAYSAAKFGVLALTQGLAKENPDTGFKCITVCPGGMNTPMRAKLFGSEDARRQQSPEFVADKILEIVEGKIPVQSGCDVVIRHHSVTAINPLPEA